MNRARIVTSSDGHYIGVAFDCPGCEFPSHRVDTDWTPEGATRAASDSPQRTPWGFNGNLERPTITPSILVTATWGEERRKVVCHSFVRNGRIEFLGDCTHALAGQTVDLPEIAE